MPGVLKVVLILMVCAAAYYDLRVRRIPNWISLSGIILGLGFNAYFDEIPGAKASILGLLLALGLYLPLYLLKGMGAGDVKLMAAIGAVVGPGNWLNIFVFTALLGGIASLVLVLMRRKVAQTLANVSTIVGQLAKGKHPSAKNGDISIHHNESLKMPHGAIIASGVCLFLALHWNV